MNSDKEYRVELLHNTLNEYIDKNGLYSLSLLMVKVLPRSKVMRIINKIYRINNN